MPTNRKSPREEKAEAKERQINVRMPTTLIERIDKTASALGIGVSGLIRMVLMKHLKEFEEWIEETQPDERPPS